MNNILDILVECDKEFVPPLSSRNSTKQYVSTRTWSTNISHINLLKKRNYENTYTIRNDRILEDGTKVDTVYFGKNLRR